MKKVLLTLTVIMAATFIGCSKDDDNNTTASIVGKWRNEKFDYFIDGQFDDTEITLEDNATCPDFIDFKSTGNLELVENDANCASTVVVSGTYVVNGAILTFGNSETSNQGKIITLTGTDLKMEFVETSSDGVVYKNVGFYKRIN